MTLQFDLSFFLIALALAAILVAQRWLIRRRAAIFGAIIPLLYCGFVGYLAWAGRLAAVTDWLFAAFGFVGLVTWWASVRQDIRGKSASSTAD